MTKYQKSIWPVAGLAVSNPEGIVDSDSGLSACIQLCQEKLYNPGLDVTINPNWNSILTHQRHFPDVRLGHTSTRHLPLATRTLSRMIYSISCLVLIDEWVAYARQFHDQSDRLDIALWMFAHPYELIL